jgi:Bacterial protein of unknown function (DUF894).
MRCAVESLRSPARDSRWSRWLGRRQLRLARSLCLRLRHPLFRRYSAGVLLSLIGNWVEAAAYGYVVLLLGGSAATLGLIGFLNTIPNLVFALPAGALADRYDRRKLLLIFQSLNMALAAALAVTWATGTLTIGLLAVLAVLGGILGTLSFAPFQAMLAATVPKQDLESAVAINSLVAAGRALRRAGDRRGVARRGGADLGVRCQRCELCRRSWHARVVAEFACRPDCCSRGGSARSARGSVMCSVSAAWRR